MSKPEIDEKLLKIIQEESKNISVPKACSKVFKDECMYSYDTPFSPKGLYVNLKTWQAFGFSFLDFDHKRTGNRLYLLQKWTILPKKTSDVSEAVAAPTCLAIGVEGGFAGDERKDEIKNENFLFVYPENVSIPLETTTSTSTTTTTTTTTTGGGSSSVLEIVPEIVHQVIDSILVHEGVLVQQESASWQEDLQVSKYYQDLEQLNNGIKISANPASWTCEACEAKENLWLNLSDGYIGCGRRNWDGSGGCGASLNHYQEKKTYPLCVKLGTITANGADVFSYACDENDMVLNPNLENHLSHWGINASKMKKSEKTMNELQIDLNISFDFNQITEAGHELIALSGNGYVGLENTGNSCYMNSILQLLFSIPQVKSHYCNLAFEIFASSPFNGGYDDFYTQICKLATGLASTEYEVISPRRFKHMVGKGHLEFSSSRQQDAMEYLIYLLEFMKRSQRTLASRLKELDNTNSSVVVAAAKAAGCSTSLSSLDLKTKHDVNELMDLFTFELQDRLECLETKKVKYVNRKESHLQLEIPLDQAINLTEIEALKQRDMKRQKSGKEDLPEEPIRPIVPFQACLDNFHAKEQIPDFYSTATGRKSGAFKQISFKTFPRYLLIQFRRYYVAEDWTPKKMDVAVPVPEKINLEPYRSTNNGLEAHEIPLPEEDDDNAIMQQAISSSCTSSMNTTTPFVPDEGLVAQLMSMGFSQNGCSRAAIATRNGTPDAAMEWIFAHMEDTDFNDPPVLTNHNSQATTIINPEHIQLLMAMGFTATQAEKALEKTDGIPDRAAEWLFSHTEEKEENMTSNNNNSQLQQQQQQESLANHQGNYSLVGIVSHMGRSTSCGHYVCHIKKDGRWVIFNDAKVAESKNPPFHLGYIYLYSRDDDNKESSS